MSFAGWTAADIDKLNTKHKPVKKKVKKINPYIIHIENGLTRAGVPFTKEYKFHPVRKWLFDFVIGACEDEILKHRLAIEFNGGVFSGGRHTQGMGYVKDMEKVNHAQLEGYRVLQYTSMDLREKNLGIDGIINQVKKLMR